MLQSRDFVMAYKCANNLAPDYLCIKLKKNHLFMIAQLVITINFKSFYIKLLAVNAHLPRSILYGTLRRRLTILHLSQGLQMLSEHQHAE